MVDFAIYADKMGAREDIPKMLLSETFLASESRNVHDEFGEYRKLKGRIPLCYDANGEKIQTPKLVYTITFVDKAAKKFVISDGLAYAVKTATIGDPNSTITIEGLHKAAIDAALAASNYVEIYGSTGNDGTWPPVSTSEGGGDTTITLTGVFPSGVDDGTIYFGSTPKKNLINADIVDSSIRVNSSTGNDGLYTVSSITDVGGSTAIVVTETVADDTADGMVFVGYTPVICYHTYTQLSSGLDYFLIGTAYHVWLWNDTNQTLTPKFTSATPASVLDMTMVTHLDCVYMTNNVDKIQWWDTSSIGNNFAVAGASDGLDVGGSVYIVKAKYLHSFESYLFVGCPTVTATPFNQRAYWSGRGTGGNSGTAIDFDATGLSDTGYKDFNREQSAIVGFASKGTDLIVAKGLRMVRGWLVTEDTVFEWAEEAVKVGCISGKTLINDGAGRLFWLASDFTIRELDTPEPISSTIERTIRDINPSTADFSQAIYVDEYKEIWFAVPYLTSTTNNLVISFNTVTAKFYFHDIPVRAFCRYRRQVVFTYDTLPYTSYHEWGIAWLVYDTKINSVGYPLDVASDYQGNSFELHSGDMDDSKAWTGKIAISTTLTSGKSPYIYKRVANGLDITFNNRAEGSASIYCRKDGEKDRTLVGTASFVDAAEPDWITVHVPFDKRARVFYFDIESSGYLEFIGMVFREFYYDGDR